MIYELLRAEDLVLNKEGTARINHMGFSAMVGESVGVIGLSGGGKTSLGKILCGEISPDGGQILQAGKALSREQLAQMGIRISGDDRLLENLSVQECLMVLGSETGRRRIRVPWRQTRNAARELLEAFGLENYLDVPTAQIPVPVQHRILMVSAAVRGKRLVVLDHVADTYSAQEERDMTGCIHKLCSMGISVLYLSGRLDSVLWELERVTVVRDGRRVKTLNKGTFTEAILRAHIYGYRSPEDGHWGGVKNTYDIEFVFDGIPLPGQGPVPVHCSDGSARVFFERLAKKTGKNAMFLNSDTLYDSFVDEMSAVDNLSMSVAQRVGGIGFHIRKSVQQLLRTECMEQTGLTFEELDLPLGWMGRMGRFKLLQYRIILEHADICVLDRITAGADLKDKEEIRRISGNLPGLVFYVSSDYRELMAFGAQIYSLREGCLRKETS